MEEIDEGFRLPLLRLGFWRPGTIVFVVVFAVGFDGIGIAHPSLLADCLQRLAERGDLALSVGRGATGLCPRTVQQAGPGIGGPDGLVGERAVVSAGY